MKAQIIQIGNSQGIRIPKVLLEETGISGEVELESSPDGIVIRNIKKPRGDWEDRFKSLAESDDDLAVDPDGSSRFDSAEWKW
jgi:antitoxin MazE